MNIGSALVKKSLRNRLIQSKIRTYYAGPQSTPPLIFVPFWVSLLGTLVFGPSCLLFILCILKLNYVGSFEMHLTQFFKSDISIQATILKKRLVEKKVPFLLAHRNQKYSTKIRFLL